MDDKLGIAYAYCSLGQVALRLGRCPEADDYLRRSSLIMEARRHHASLKRQRGDGFVARCIELPGCLSEGETEAETFRNIQDAIKRYVEDVEAEAKEKKARLIRVKV
jgi:predicted RNase H-like HicB family nuclease